MPGQGLVARTIQGNIASGQLDRQLTEQRRSNQAQELEARKNTMLRAKGMDMNKAMAGRQADIAERQAAIGERRNVISSVQTKSDLIQRERENVRQEAQSARTLYEDEQNRQEFRNKTAQSYEILIGEVDKQTTELMVEEQAAITAEKAKKTGMNEEAIRLLPHIKALTEKANKSEYRRDGVVESIRNSKNLSKVIMQSDRGENFLFNSLGPLAISKLDDLGKIKYDADIAKGQVNLGQITSDLVQRQMKLQGDMEAEQAASQAGQVSEAIQEDELEKIRARTQGQLDVQAIRAQQEAQAEDAANTKKNFGNRLSNLGTTIKGAKQKYKNAIAFGEIRSSFGSDVEKMSNDSYLNDVYGSDQASGVQGFLDRLYLVKGDETKIRNLMDIIPTLRADLSTNSPFHEIYDFFGNIPFKAGKKDLPEVMGVVMKGWNTEAPKPTATLQ